MKNCSRCKTDKPETEFYPRVGHGGLTPHCKSCDRVRVDKYRAANKDRLNQTKMEWSRKNPEKITQYRKTDYWNNREARKASVAEYRRRNPHKAREWGATFRRKNPEYERDRSLRRYGLSPEKFSEMFESQGGVCKVCQKPQPPPKRLFVDHCHDTGKVRGLLCQWCNSMLGYVRDGDPNLLLAGKRYLDESYE